MFILLCIHFAIRPLRVRLPLFKILNPHITLTCVSHLSRIWIHISKTNHLIIVVVTMVKILLVIYRSKVDPIGSGAPGEREHLTSRPASQYS